MDYCIHNIADLGGRQVSSGDKSIAGVTPAILRLLLTMALCSGFLLLLLRQYLGRKIEHAKERYMLYYLEILNASNKVMSNLSLPFLSSSNEDSIWLHLFCLGHPFLVF
ncbi:hypothetical protein KFK09_004117 [Dendrobium nobile]|uniref:Uncharacterized protein n=1 Tax=Dendrobium nobile TaxID=94219 RepID=A0A8T3C1Y1_DENNO|nr:hypothetical protein KFK09_004117 [Dendrobium nobile]